MKQTIQRERRHAVIRGAAEQVIRVRLPVPGVFREAVFFLHEDYMKRGDLSRDELLRQARRSAEEYLKPFETAHGSAMWWPYPLLFAVGACAGIALSMLF